MGCRVNDNNLATQRPFFLRASDEQALVPFQDSSPRSNCVRFTI